MATWVRRLVGVELGRQDKTFLRTEISWLGFDMLFAKNTWYNPPIANADGKSTPTGNGRSGGSLMDTMRCSPTKHLVHLQ